MHKIVVFVPHSHLEAVKLAMFDAGAGKMGRYDQCCWQVHGHGQFRALEGSDPYVGEHGKVHVEYEWRVEMISEADKTKQVVDAMKQVHPYEEVAYEVYQLLDNF